jgi:aldose 1-epimerase
MKIDKKSFGKLKNSKSADLFTFTNDNGMTVSITNYGGIITKIMVNDTYGNPQNVALGFDSIDDYEKNNYYFGATIGRYANRISGGKFSINGKSFKLEKNNGNNHIHGGKVGFDKVVWKAETFKDGKTIGLILNYSSKDGEGGYPGKLSCKVIYTITNKNEIEITYEATTNKDTICNFTNHSYFNLKDGGKTSILDHEIKINADYFTPIDEESIPTGKLRSVSGTPFEFSSLRLIGDLIEEDDPQIQNGKGYDHNFVIRGDAGKLRKAATVIQQTSGIVLDVETTEPGMQFYTGNHLENSIKGRGNTIYDCRNGFCLETQHYPDSPNKPHFPNTILKTGEKFTSKTIYRFSIIQNTEL